MLDRDDAGAAPDRRRPTSERVNSAATSIVAVSGLMGAAGVAVSAAATHQGGGSLASTAGLFLFLHAATGIALASFARSSDGHARGLLVSAVLLVFGTIVFAGDLAMLGFAALRPFPGAAPLGGLMMIAGWLGIPLTVLLGRWRKGRI